MLRAEGAVRKLSTALPTSTGEARPMTAPTRIDDMPMAICRR
jgi:hypothetical protein